MFPSQFAYERPASVAEAVQLLLADPNAKLLAGGHSLIPAMKLRLASPSMLVDLAGVDNIDGISVNGGVAIGAMATYEAIRDSAELKSALPLLPAVAYNIGDRQVQAMGTIGGSLAHADPASDLTAVVLALGGEVTAVGPNGERTIGADDLFVDLFTTSLEPEEIITEVRLPAPGSGTGMAYEKYRHPASGYAVVGIAAKISTGADGNVDDARIAVTGCTSKATRATASEQALLGKPLNAESIAAAAAVAADGLEINGDTYASAEYRGHLVGVYTKRALESIAGDLG